LSKTIQQLVFIFIFISGQLFLMVTEEYEWQQLTAGAMM
jgi:hypothetical protein